MPTFGASALRRGLSTLIESRAKLGSNIEGEAHGEPKVGMCPYRRLMQHVQNVLSNSRIMALWVRLRR